MHAYLTDPATRVQAPVREGTITYFIQAEDGGPIKIGKSLEHGVEQRLMVLQIGNPRKLRITHTLKGDQEAKLHYRYRHLHIQGEWFYPDPVLAQAARGIASEVDLAAPEIREAYKRGFSKGYTEASRKLSKETGDYLADVVRGAMMSQAMSWKGRVTAKLEKELEGLSSGQALA